MKRVIDNQLVAWKQSAQRRPLLLFGARQVGKTYALEALGQSQFSRTVRIDFSRDSAARSIFEGSLDPAHIVAAIEATYGIDIAPEDTLLIFDEIQLCEPALTSLKYFCEDAPQYCVASAGSLLGVKLREQGSFPVGKVDMMTMHPLSFQEYLWARGEQRVDAIVEDCLAGFSPCPVHDKALDLLREYLLVGGMPAAVVRFVEQVGASAAQAYEAARQAQLEIDQAYVADIAKHAPGNEIPRILDVWKSIPSQLAKENHKFQYKVIKSGARAATFENAVAWLMAAAIVSRCTNVSEPVAPLQAFEQPSAFKLYRADTGLLAASYEALPADLEPNGGKGSRFRGAMAESYVMQQLTAADVSPHYWGVPSKAEVDFVVRDKEGNVVPIEVKSGDNVRSRSLSTYQQRFKPAYAVRLSTKNFGNEGNVRSIPLYGAYHLAEQFMKSPAYV